jgi:hypothetical protein
MKASLAAIFEGQGGQQKRQQSSLSESPFMLKLQRVNTKDKISKN